MKQTGLTQYNHESLKSPKGRSQLAENLHLYYLVSTVKNIFRLFLLYFNDNFK